MSFASAFRGIAARYGQSVVLFQNGTKIGSAMAILRPLHDQDRQIIPTQLGRHQQDTVLCLADPALPAVPGGEGLTLDQGSGHWTVQSVRPIEAGDERICWRLILVRREEAPA